MQQVGLYEFLEKLGFFDLLPAPLSEMATLVNPPPPPLPDLPPIFAPAGSRRARVALFVGCVADAMFRPTHWATLRVLAANGCEVVVPRGQGCCGAIHHHSGDREGARRMADLNTDAFRPDDVDAIVVNHAGCGAMLREYPIRWNDARTQARTRLASKVRDLSEFLAQLGPVPPAGRIEAVATYHDACHLGHAQKIRTQPRQLLELIPGLEVKPLPETEICCGSAGTYNLYQPEMARRLGRRKLDAIRSTGARIVLAANAGCLLHIGREIRRAEADLLLMHPIELLDYSYRRERPAGIGSPPASSV
jgi:glycolate oxidase iron-sulfur subunit